MAAVNELEAANHGASPHFWKLALGSVGVVYGDIGTSPLYALREALHGAARDGILGEGEVIGIVSLAALDADPDRDAQVRCADAAGRQPRRRWDTLSACARSARGRAPHPAAPRSGDCRGRALLRRRRDHAGHLGALGRRGAQARDAGLGALTFCQSPSRSSLLFSGCRAAAPSGSQHGSARSRWCGS